MAHYNQTTPPIWNLTNIRVPLRLFAGTSDLLADVKDVDFMWSKLDQPAKAFYKIYNSGHCTFVWGNDITPWMSDIERMLKEEQAESVNLQINEYIE